MSMDLSPTSTHAKGTGIINEANAPQGPVKWVFMKEDLDWLIAAVSNAEVGVIDLETTGLDQYATATGPTNGGVAARISLASITLPQKGAFGVWDGVEPTTYVVPLSHPDSPWVGSWRAILRQILRAFVVDSVPISNQHIKFDSKWWYAHTGLDTAHLIEWDTQVGAHLLDETTSTSLKDRAPKTFGIPRWDDHDLSKPGASERVPLIELGEYAARDTYWTWRLEREERRRMWLLPDSHETPPETPEEIQEARLGQLATWVAMPTVRSLTRIEQRGIALDVDYTQAKLKEALEIREDALDRLADKYSMHRPDASIEANAYWFKELTQRAVARGELEVISMTEKGNAQWTKGVLTRLTRRPATSETAQMILDAKRSTKDSQFLRSWLMNVTPAGLIHTTYWPGRVVTGRLSSEGPNMQQVSKKLRPCFISRDGYFMADFDYSQIELRIAAFISRCIPMLEAFRDGKDLHRIFGAKIAGVREEDVTPEQRQKAKAGNFGLLYDMSAYGFKMYAEDAYDVVLTEAEAVAIHAAFFELWDGLRQWHNRVRTRVQHDGFIVSPIGRVRRLPGIWDQSSSMVSFSERAAINSPVQGFGSDLMQMAAASIQGLLPISIHKPVRGAYPVGTVHDSIVVELEMERAQEAAAEVQTIMVTLDQVLAKMGVVLDVPLVADVTVGTRWGWSDVSDGWKKEKG